MTSTQNPAQQTIVVNESQTNITGNALTSKLEQQSKLVVNGSPINSNVKKELIQKVLAPNFQKKINQQQITQSQNSDSIIRSSLIEQQNDNNEEFDENDDDDDDEENKKSFVVTADYIQQSKYYLFCNSNILL